MVHTKAPLAISEGESLDPCEDKRVGEAGEEREKEHNWFADKHMERSYPNSENLLEVYSVFL